MVLSEHEIKEILQHYDLGSLVKFRKRLEDGFQSENFHIETKKGDFVVRILDDTEKNINLSMKICNNLVKNGIKTPAPMITRDNAFFLKYKKHFVVIQTFLEGADIYDSRKISRLLGFFGKELGKLHRASIQMVDELGNEMFMRDEDTIASVRNLAARFKINDEYVLKKFKEWEYEISQLPVQLLTKAVIHGDIGPKDFFFKEREFMGIIDFGAAGYDYLLFDIAPMMMYCGLYYPHNLSGYARFVHAYLEESPIKKEEFKWLYMILKTRWLLQIYFHQYRYVEGITRGLDTGKREENLQGVVDGKVFLKILEKFTPEDFFKVL